MSDTNCDHLHDITKEGLKYNPPKELVCAECIKTNSSWVNLRQCPANSIQSPVSSIQSPVSSIQSPVSSIQSPAYSLQETGDREQSTGTANSRQLTVYRLWSVNYRLLTIDCCDSSPNKNATSHFHTTNHRVMTSAMQMILGHGVM